MLSNISSCSASYDCRVPTQFGDITRQALKPFTARSKKQFIRAGGVKPDNVMNIDTAIRAMSRLNGYQQHKNTPYICEPVNASDYLAALYPLLATTCMDQLMAAHDRTILRHGPERACISYAGTN